MTGIERFWGGMAVAGLLLAAGWGACAASPLRRVLWWGGLVVTIALLALAHPWSLVGGASARLFDRALWAVLRSPSWRDAICRRRRCVVLRRCGSACSG